MRKKQCVVPGPEQSGQSINLWAARCRSEA
jgi:hypothetical protein